MRRIRSILFVHAGSELYGADKILAALVRSLANHNWQITVVLPWRGELAAILEADGANVIVLNHGVLRRKYFSPCGLLNRFVRILLAGRILARLIADQRIDIVHTNTSVVMAGALAAAIARVPHIWHIHEITTRPVIVWRLLSWLIPRTARKVVCVSDAVRAHLCTGDRLNEQKSVVIHNGIFALPAGDEDRNRVRRELGLSDEDVLVGMIGRVNAWKGQMALAEAAAKVIVGNQNVRFLFVGGTFSGEEYLLETLRRRTSADDLRGRAQVFGFRSDVPAIMAALDIFVLPSVRPDPLPTVVLEAMSLARPIVAFNHGGVREMISEGETGLLVPPCDTDGLAKAILRLSADATLRKKMGALGQARFESDFELQTFLDAWEATYRDALTN